MSRTSSQNRPPQGRAPGHEAITRYSEADLPTARGPLRIVVYRVGDDPDEEHVAMVHGQVRGGRDILCRVHSECFTSEVMGSLRCDCREQLDRALERIADEDAGVLVYLRQEGRGIGLGNKVRAYALQDQGRDTVDANLALGFEADLRSYELAAAILRDLGVESVRLMTNNPDKLRGLESAGITVTAHEPHWVDASEHSADYLHIKRSKMGHIAATDTPLDKDASGT
ncbi:GTP cyclohydrolase II [Haliangium sp.]|uniref:GTP cyclohydrolase II n=1 Tax=Haliangium sp. TaxID=2663208 RepID=UPI003D1032E7